MQFSLSLFYEFLFLSIFLLNTGFCTLIFLNIQVRLFSIKMNYLDFISNQNSYTFFSFRAVWDTWCLFRNAGTRKARKSSRDLSMSRGNNVKRNGTAVFFVILGEIPNDVIKSAYMAMDDNSTAAIYSCYQKVCKFD